MSSSLQAAPAWSAAKAMRTREGYGSPHALVADASAGHLPACVGRLAVGRLRVVDRGESLEVGAQWLGLDRVDEVCVTHRPVDHIARVTAAFRLDFLIWTARVAGVLFHRQSL